jgi:glycerophosphoryl diester phosphodiesterase
MILSNRIIGFISVVIITCLTGVCHAQKFQPAENSVVAHRGAWKSEQLPQNSIASLRKAIELQTTGSEFDVLMTADDSLVVTHGPDYEGMPIEQTTYEKLAVTPLSNGEKLPTLREYFRAGIKENTTTLLICEIKPSQISTVRGEGIAEKVLELASELNAGAMITYISFDYNILQKIVELQPEARTQYLAGDVPPKKLKADGISGADYNVEKYKERPEWIESAKENEIILNAWTVNEAADMNWLLDHGFDFITTDEPKLLMRELKARVGN